MSWSSGSYNLSVSFSVMVPEPQMWGVGVVL